MLSSDSNGFTFDYHLNANEQRILNQAIKTYRGQKTACYCNIAIDQQPPKKLILVRLNYLIRIYNFSKQMKCKLLHEIHILRIHHIRTIDDYTTEILYENHKLVLNFQACDRFTHKLIRDYRYISALVKPNLLLQRMIKANTHLLSHVYHIHKVFNSFMIHYVHFIRPFINTKLFIFFIT